MPNLPAQRKRASRASADATDTGPPDEPKPQKPGAAADRARVRRVLRVVQGHPKLMELADAAAADRDPLDTQLAAAEKAAAGQGLEAFFRDGSSTLDPASSSPR